MPNPNPNKSGLKSQQKQAPDATEPTAPVTAKIEISTIQWLNSLSGGRSYHIRQALRLYREALKGISPKP